MEKIQILDLEVSEYIKCDACPGRARYGFTLVNGKLDFCFHHYKKYQNALHEQAIQTVEYQQSN